MTEFVDELPPRFGRDKPPSAWSLRLAADLRANPGRWAKWPRPTSNAQSTAASVRRDRYPALPSDVFEAASREGVCYVRYIGASS